MGYTSCGILGESILLNNYILNHAPNLKLVGVPVPLFFVDMPQGGDEFPGWFVGSIEQSRGYIYDSLHSFWNNGLPSGFQQCMAAISDSATLAQNPWDSLGDMIWPSLYGWQGSNPQVYGPATWTVANTTYQKNFVAFVNIIKTLSARNIHLLAINFPESPYYKYTNHYEEWDLSWPTGQTVMSQVSALQAEYPYFHVYDAYQNGNHDYTDSDAYDSYHLCTTGAKKLTPRLDSVIQGILNN